MHFSRTSYHRKIRNFLAIIFISNTYFDLSQLSRISSFVNAIVSIPLTRTAYLDYYAVKPAAAPRPSCRSAVFAIALTVNKIHLRRKFRRERSAADTCRICFHHAHNGIYMRGTDPCARACTAGSCRGCGNIWIGAKIHIEKRALSSLK